jgi:hypothetical protein
MQREWLFEKRVYALINATPGSARLQRHLDVDRPMNVNHAALRWPSAGSSSASARGPSITAFRRQIFRKKRRNKSTTAIRHNCRIA